MRISNVIFLFLCADINVVSFTREYRKYDYPIFQFDGQSLQLSFDPGIMDFKNVIASFCSQFQCSQPQAVLSSIESAFDTRIDDYFKSLLRRKPLAGHTSRWADFSDSSIAKEYLKADSSIKEWREFLVTNNATSQVGGVEFRQVISKLIPTYSQTHHTESSLNLVDIASEMFNSEYYEHAMMLCSMYILDLIEKKWAGDPDSMVAALNIMAESHRISGEMQHAVMYYMKVLPGMCVYVCVDGLLSMCHTEEYHSCPSPVPSSLTLPALPPLQIIRLHETLPSLPPRQDIHRLRLLMAIPPLPPPYPLAVKQRAMVSEDIATFSERLKTHSGVVSLQVPHWNSTVLISLRISLPPNYYHILWV